jgi:hypothetical protein
MHTEVTTDFYEKAWFCSDADDWCLQTSVQFLNAPDSFYDSFDPFTDNFMWENWKNDPDTGAASGAYEKKIYKKAQRQVDAVGNLHRDYIELIDC